MVRLCSKTEKATCEVVCSLHAKHRYIKCQPVISGEILFYSPLGGFENIVI